MDFARLSKNGIFGIFGKTGSGKSTILDAIVLALYGEVVENTGNKDFVNTDCNETYVSLDFSVKSGGEVNYYRAERLFKYNKAHTALSVSLAKLWKITDSGEYAVAENSVELNKKIENDVIGLKKNEFLKCIALPQGDFAAFIKLQRGERLKMIGKLFDLEKYGAELYQKVADRDSALEKEQSELNGTFAELSGCDPESVALIKKELEAKQTEMRECADKYERAKSENEKAKKYASLNDERNKKKAILNEKSAYKPIIDGYREKIKLYDKLLKVSDKINGALKAAQNCNELEAKLQELYGQKEQLREKEERTKKNAEQLKALEDELSELKEKSGRLQDASKKQQRLTELGNRREKLLSEYNTVKAKSLTVEKQKAEALIKKGEYERLCNECGFNELLEKLAAFADGAALKEFIAGREAFTAEIEKLISKSADSSLVSAVNRLIDGENAKLHSFAEKFLIADSPEKRTKEELIEDILKKAKMQSDYLKKSLDFGKCAEVAEKELQKLAEDMTRAVEEGKKCRAEYDETEAELMSITGGEKYEIAKAKNAAAQAEKSARIKAINTDNALIAELIAGNKAKIETISAQAEKANADKKEYMFACERTLAETGLSLSEAAKILADGDETDKLRSLVLSHDNEAVFCEKRIGEINELIKEYSDYFDTAFFAAKAVECENNLENTRRILNKISDSYENGLKKSERWCIINERLGEIASLRGLYSKLFELVRAGRFMEFIADEYLKDVANSAKSRVLELTGGRYGLLYRGDFYVTDNLKGGAERKVSSLSGGETFLVSLSLALALAFEISKKALKPIDFFFLDEGFGTLDEELIETVTDSLEKLRRADLTVGLISHVSELKNRIASKLFVKGADVNGGTEFTCVCD